MNRVLHPPLGKRTDTAKKLNETQYPASSAARLQGLERKSPEWRKLFNAGKKQGGLQEVFVRFSMGLKAEQGLFFAKQERRENKACVWRSCKVSLFINPSESSRKNPVLTGCLSSSKCP